MSRKIIFLIQQHTNLLDVAGASQVFGEAKEYGIDLEIVFTSLETNIKSGVGLPLGKITNFSNINLSEGDILFIISTDIQYIMSDKYRVPHKFIEWIKNAYNNNVKICAICNGAFLLAKTGLLDGRKCTTHWKRTKELQTLFPKLDVQENVIFVEDTGIITSAGGTSGVDVSLHLLATLQNDYFAHKVARELVVYQRRNGSDAQLSILLESRNHMHKGIHKVQDFVQSNLHKKVNLNKLSGIANMSYRNFCRIFKKETDLTTIQYINMVRKDRINNLIKNKDLSRKQIANLVGLESERQVSRLIKSYS
ncbi:MAG: AraC family transcriptional regulator [Saprospiraceae bacterium]|nr:AraC family transcriptional regulator [Saprospiraceae bacterium]